MFKKLDNSEVKNLEGGLGGVISQMQYDSDSSCIGKWQAGTCTEPSEWKTLGFNASYEPELDDSWEGAVDRAREISKSGNVYIVRAGNNKPELIQIFN